MNILITGSSGLIGSEAVTYFDNLGHSILGIDNNMRKDFFGPNGDTTWNLKRLMKVTRDFTHHETDIRDQETILNFFENHRLDAVIHCAAQPSHDLASYRPFDDFGVNAVGTMNLLEATRLYNSEAVFIFMSTNKVYGDAPNEKEFEELETRWEYANSEDYNGINESCRIDRSKHSLFGASKVAADVMVQEYGYYFGMKTVCFRCGCLTGQNHSGVELHGFLSYLVKVAVTGKKYTIYGYKGKQVRDHLHSLDVVRAFDEFIKNPRIGEVYNLGGGRKNSASILECFEKIQELIGTKIRYEYNEKHRKGDHICYISDLTKLKSHYRNWCVTKSLNDIIEEMVNFELERIAAN